MKVRVDTPEEAAFLNKLYDEILKERAVDFALAYKETMNQLLKTLEYTEERAVEIINSMLADCQEYAFGLEGIDEQLEKVYQSQRQALYDSMDSTLKAKQLERVLNLNGLDCKVICVDLGELLSEDENDEDVGGPTEGHD